MKNDLCLRFPDEATAIATLPQFHDAENGWHLASHVHALDPVGALEIIAAVLDLTGQYPVEVTPAVFAEGFHVNLLTDDDALLAVLRDFIITPTNRKRVWA